MAKYPDEIIIGLATGPGDTTFKAVMLLLDESIESEVASALSKENRGEDRAWHAGRAESLASFRALLSNIRAEIAAEQGIRVDKSS